jgi:predicted negative regulator of RcsB-dependent stress response
VASTASGALAERSLLDMARHQREKGSLDVAMATLNRLGTSSNRYAPHGLELRADLLSDQGKVEEARKLYERILVEFESYVMMDGVRDKLRSLPATKPGDLP